MRLFASVSTATAGSNTLGVAVAPRQFNADQLLAKADLIRTMHERVQPCQDPQTEFALLGESFDVSRIYHFFRVHGHAFLQERRAAGPGRSTTLDVCRVASPNAAAARGDAAQAASERERKLPHF